MTRKEEYTGFAIALAWPETYCKQPGSWYDPVTQFLGFNKYNYYRAGHAALVLIEKEEKKCHYFDFGRYHAPWGHGRVRSEKTDHDLKIHTRVEISADGERILNFDTILNELQNNDACHGEGNLHASYANINFKKSFSKALQMQKESPILYGPFIRNGSNCSRFVNTVIRAGNPLFRYHIRLKYRIPLTPTPMNNVNAFPNKQVKPKFKELKKITPNRSLSKSEMLTTLPPPIRHPKIPETTLWLSGEGAGSWFDISRNGNFIHAVRYSPDGKRECEGIFENEINIFFENDSEIEILYPSHCGEINLRYNGTILTFKRRKEPESGLSRAV
ncbi:MAG: DUF6695 family protein [Bacteroidales bacterium]